ncbi:kinetochore protein Spc25 [Vanacampus margaritifer]
MESVDDPEVTINFDKKMTEAHKRILKEFAEMKDIRAELTQTHREFVRMARDEVIKKCADDEILFETIERLTTDQHHKNESLLEKQHALTEVASNSEQKEIQKNTFIREMEKLQEEKDKAKELIESQNKTNKDRLKNLQKARFIFEENLRMEMRKIDDDRLQFVFRSIDAAHPDRPYVITIELSKEGSYQSVSSKPALEGLPDLERRLQETNKLAVFLKKAREQFISQARQEGVKNQE